MTHCFLSAELDEITNNAMKFEQLLTDCVKLLYDTRASGGGRTCDAAEN
jgi:hypothetical protein